ncbi:MAG: 2-hydroxyacid dehydrogenase [Alphaproteobacteria bacterium]
MNVVLRRALGDKPVELLKQYLTTPWAIRMWDGDPTVDEFPLDAGDALVAMRFTPADAEAMPNLRFLQLPGAGFEQIDFDTVAARCTVCNAFEHEHGIAEYVFAAMLEWQIGLQKMHGALREGAWEMGFAGGPPSHGELRGKTLGLIGYGRIGREIAVRAKAFGMTVSAVTRTPEKAEGSSEPADQVAGMDRLAALCKVSDFIVVACPLTETTRGLIGTAEFGAMKRRAVLINVARGPVVDEDALFTACSEGQIGGAIIDVWYQYPAAGSNRRMMPSGRPFHELDNVIMTPHASGWTYELVDRRWRVIAENLDRFARGEPLRNIVLAPREKDETIA